MRMYELIIIMHVVISDNVIRSVDFLSHLKSDSGRRVC